MKAAVLFGPGDVRVTDFPEPPMTDDTVKIAVAYCSLCGTDFHKYNNQAGSRPVVYPVPLGHEVSGIVVETGKDVTDFKVGDRVTVDPNWSCGHCEYCKKGQRHLCENSKGVVKGLAEYICPPQENVYHLPDSLSLRDAALTEPLSCCLHGLDLLGIKQGDTVAIVGCGAIGQIMLQLCRASAAGDIAVIEPVEEKKEMAFAQGATVFINPNAGDPEQALLDAGITCVEKVIECGGITATAETAVKIAGRGATVLLFSVGSKGSNVSFDSYDIFYKELNIKGSYINPGTMQRSINILNKGLLDVDKLISRQMELDDVPEEMATRTYSRLGKVMVRVGGDNIL